jgi:hypothetical protein
MVSFSRYFTVCIIYQLPLVHKNKLSLLLDVLDDEYESTTVLLNVGNNSSKDTASVTAYQPTRPNIYEESVSFNNSRCISIASIYAFFMLICALM